jgi:hypothetical protein
VQQDTGGLQMTAAMTCRACGGEPRAGARFCAACGEPIASTRPATELGFEGHKAMAEAMP